MTQVNVGDKGYYHTYFSDEDTIFAYGKVIAFLPNHLVIMDGEEQDDPITNCIKFQIEFDAINSEKRIFEDIIPEEWFIKMEDEEYYKAINETI